MKTHHALSLLLITTLAACAGSPGYYAGEPAKNSYNASYDAPAATAPTSASSGYASSGDATSARMSAPGPAPSSDGDYGGAAESGSAYQPVPREQPTERPGLGTVFGENVHSQVSMKPFVRAAATPFAAVAMHYNDADGVRAHAAYLGQQGLAPFRAYTPAGGITVALTDQYGNLLSGGLANGRALVVGQEGQRYNIVIENQTGGRYEVVTSVDGLDVIDGRPASTAKRGYILEPYSSLTIDGFRQSEYEVAAFRFGRVSESYAARTSGDRNVGVIGTAFFAERGSVWTTDELQRRDSANPFPAETNYARPPSY